MPRLFGQLGGDLTFGDRATYFGEIFDLSATETPTGGDSPWTNIAAAAVRWTNIGATVVAEDFTNLSVAGSSNWENTI